MKTNRARLNLLLFGLPTLWAMLDQGLKHFEDSHWIILDRYPVLGHWLLASRTHNLGIIGDRYSFNEDPADTVYYVRYYPTLAFMAFAILLGLRWKGASRTERLGAMLLVSGAVSNLISQWSAEYVTDTLQLWIGGETYLPFNLADLALTTGAIVIFWAGLRSLFAPRAQYAQ
jgi:signal peptidase II